MCLATRWNKEWEKNHIQCSFISCVCETLQPCTNFSKQLDPVGRKMQIYILASPLKALSQQLQHWESEKRMKNIVNTYMVSWLWLYKYNEYVCTWVCGCVHWCKHWTLSSPTRIISSPPETSILKSRTPRIVQLTEMCATSHIGRLGRRQGHL